MPKTYTSRLLCSWVCALKMAGLSGFTPQPPILEEKKKTKTLSRSSDFGPSHKQVRPSAPRVMWTWHHHPSAPKPVLLLEHDPVPKAASTVSLSSPQSLALPQLVALLSHAKTYLLLIFWD